MIWDFSAFMALALVVTGAIWGLDRLLLARRRGARAAVLATEGRSESEQQAATREPVLVEYARAFFPVILIVFLLRSFLVEPFRIPSGSMMPNLLAGDFILVNKFTYGIRIPVWNHRVIELNTPRHGDVMVFRFPGDPGVNYIKRVVGVPGDRIQYIDRKIYINGKLMEQGAATDYIYSENGERRVMTQRVREQLDTTAHDILLSAGAPLAGNLEFSVPDGQYFVMGDNRDRSNDSRYWGTVPDENIVGRAFFIWFSWDQNNGGGVAWSRMGSRIE